MAATGTSREYDLLEGGACVRGRGLGTMGPATSLPVSRQHPATGPAELSLSGDTIRVPRHFDVSRGCGSMVFIRKLLILKGFEAPDCYGF